MAAGRDGFIPPFMDAPTLAAHLCLSVDTINTLVNTGQLPAPLLRLGHKRLWRWSEVEDRLAPQPITSNAAGPDPQAERIRENTRKALSERR